jgi:hypothetical protein
MVGDAHITEAPAVDTATRRPIELPQRLKSAAPTAGAIGVIAAIVAGTMIATSPDGGQTASVTPEAASAPPPAGPAMPGIAFDQTPGAGSPVQRNVELVVKFKDDSKIKDIVEAFWRDPAAAKARFGTWSANRAEFAGLRLDRVTYSNELVLVLKDGGAPAERAAAIRDAVKKLGAAPDISYAEQQATLAQPGGQ